MKTNNRPYSEEKPSSHINQADRRFKNWRPIFALFTLGILGAIYTSRNLHAASVTWTGATDQTWSNSNNWSPATVEPAAGSDVFFNNIGASGSVGTVTNIVDTSGTINSLSYLNTTGSSHTTQISPGVTLSINGNTISASGTNALIVGGTNTPAVNSNVAITGGGSLVINGGTTNSIYIGNFGASGDVATLDMSGLGTFTATLNALNVGTLTTQSNSQGNIILGGTNSITANTIAVGAGMAGGGTSNSSLKLGTVNTLNADSINIAFLRQSGTITFNGGLISPTVTIRNRAGTGRAALTMGSVVGSTAATSTAQFDLTAGTVDALFSSITIGQTATSSGNGNGAGTFSFSAGSVDATSITLGNLLNTGTGQATGTFNINGGTLAASSVVLASATTATVNGFATGVFNLNGGTASISTLSLVNKVSTAAATMSGTFNLNSGTLKAQTIQAGSSGANGTISRTFNWGSGTIQNYNSSTDLTITTDVPITLTGLNSDARTFQEDTGRSITVNAAIGDGGAGLGIVNTGSGTLNLSASNNFSGGMTVSSGTVSANAPSATGGGTVTLNGGKLIANASSVAGAGAVIVNSGAILGGTGSVLGTVTVNSGGHLAPGNSVGTLTLGSLTLSASSILDYEFGGGNDLANVTTNNGLTINGGGFNLYQAGTQSPFTTPGIYNLFSFAGTVQGTGTSALSVLNPVGTDSYTFGISGSFVTITIASTATSGTWNGGSGSWGLNTKWTPNTVPNSQGAIATLSNASSGTITLDGNKTVGSIIINATGYTISSGSGGTLFLDNGIANATITSNTGSATFSAPISVTSSNALVTVSTPGDSVTMSGTVSGNGGVIKNGNGTLALTGSNSYLGGTVLNGGTTQINGASSLGATSGATAINNATLEAQNSITTSRNFQLGNANSTIQIDGGSTYEIDGSIANGTGTGTLNQTGNGLLILTGSNTYSGGTVVQSGTLQVGNGGAGATIGTGGLTNNGAVVINHTDTLTVTGAVSGTGSIVQNGGKLALLSNGSGYSGSTTITSSTLSLGANAAAGTGSIVLNNATLTETTTTTSSNAIAIQGTNVIDTFGSSNMSLNGALSGSGSITRNAGSGTLTLGDGSTGNLNSGFTGVFSNTSGSVTFLKGGTTNGGDNAQWSFTGGGTVTLSNIGGTISFGSLSGSENITASNNTTRIRVGDLSLSSTYSGIITGGTSNGAGLLKLGSGTLTLTAQNTNFTGTAITNLGGAPVVVAGGSIVVGASTTGTSSGPLGGSGTVVLLGNNGALFNAGIATGGAFDLANPITVSSGTGSSTGYTLSLTGTTNSNSTFSGAITLQNNLSVAQVAATGSNGLNLTGGIAGTAAGTGPGDTSNPTTISSATDSINNTGTNIVTFAGPGAINVSGTISDGGGQVGVTVTGGSTTLSASNTYTGSTNANGGTLAFAVSETLTGGLNVGTSGTAVLTAHTGGAANVKVLDISSLAISLGPIAQPDTATDVIGTSDPGSGLASPAPVPEPGTIGLTLVGGIALLSLFQRTRRKKSPD